MRWALANLGLFLLTTIAGAVVIGVLDAGSLGVGQGVFAAGFFIAYMFPGWLLHLIILGLLPAEWPGSRARLVSIVAGPLLMILPTVTEGVLWSPLTGSRWPTERSLTCFSRVASTCETTRADVRDSLRFRRPSGV